MSIEDENKFDQLHFEPLDTFEHPSDFVNDNYGSPTNAQLYQLSQRMH